MLFRSRRYAALQEFAPVFGYAADERTTGTDLPGIDFVRLAEGHGLKAARVEDLNQLESSLNTALQADGPYLLELIIS